MDDADAAPTPGSATPKGSSTASSTESSTETSTGTSTETRSARWAGRARRLGRFALPALVWLAVIVAGTAIGAALAPPVTTQVGPFTTQVRIQPSLTPGVHLELPPAGQVSFNTYLAPVEVRAGITTVNIAEARTLLSSPNALAALQREAPDELRSAAIRAALISSGCALLGVVGLGLLVYRRSWRKVAAAGTGLLALQAALGLGVATTFNPDSFAQPKFSGLLSQAPYVATQADDLIDRLESYRSGLGSILQAVTTLYGMSGRLPVLEGSATADVVTVLHVSDLHMSPLGTDLTQRLVRDFKADMVIDTGDITTWGTDAEASSLSWVGGLGVPYVFVRGNHDSRVTEQALARNKNVTVLDDAVTVVDGVVIAGIGDPNFTPDQAASQGSGTLDEGDPQVVAGSRLAQTIERWNTTRPGKPVTIAAVHEPYSVPPLLGKVPLVLTGHFHSREVKADPSGTLVMREGSTGGAGISADFKAIEEGKPTPLNATLLYIARTGERAGQVLAYDEVTMGGFGFASAQVQRTVLREPSASDPVGAGAGTPSPSGPGAPSGSP